MKNENKLQNGTFSLTILKNRGHCTVCNRITIILHLSTLGSVFRDMFFVPIVKFYICFDITMPLESFSINLMNWSERVNLQQ